MSRQEEYLKHLAESAEEKTKTNSIQGGEDETSKLLLEEIRKLNQSNEKLAARVNEMAAVREDVVEMKKYLAERDGYQVGGVGDKGKAGRFRIPKCEACLKSGAFCKHCALCGESGHKQKDCPKKE